MVQLSVVIPVYRCAGCLLALHERLTASLVEIAASYELIFVDDASPDDAWETLLLLASTDTSVRAYRLSRNFGEEMAITAGLAQANGSWVVVMDCDLQDQPEAIPGLWAKAQEGYDIVFTARRHRHHGLLRIAASRAYVALLRTFLKTDIDAAYGNFSIVSRRVVDAVLQIRDRDRHYRAILFWLGYKRTSVDVQHAPRHAGRSSYSVPALLQHAADGIFFQTSVLMRWVVYVGFVTALLGVALGAVFVISYFLAETVYAGWTSLAVLILLIGGFIITSTGIAGLYIGKTFAQVKDRPLYIIEASAGGGREEQALATIERA